MGKKGEDTCTRTAALSDVMSIETCRVTAIRNRVKIATERRGVGQQQRGHVGQPAGQETVLMLPLRAVGVVSGKGRCREDLEPSEQPEGRIKIKVTDVTATFLVQQLQGEQTEQRLGGWDHTRAGIIRLGHAVVETDTRQKWQEEENTGDPRAQATSGCQRDPTHVSNERRVRTDDGAAVGLTGRATTGWGKEKGGPCSVRHCARKSLTKRRKVL